MFLVQLQFLRTVRKKNENKHLAVARHEPTSFLEKIHRPRKKLQHARILHHCNRNTPLALNTNKKLHHSTKNCAKRDGGISSKNDSMELCIYVLFQLDWHFQLMMKSEILTLLIRISQKFTENCSLGKTTATLSTTLNSSRKPFFHIRH
jgi:hypothetical protein